MASLYSPTADSFPLVKTYKSYKRSTNSIIRWLATESGALLNQTTFRVKELEEFAKKVAQRTTAIPEHIYQSFEEAVKGRRLVTAYFKNAELKSDEKTESHEYFTNALVSIFESLREGALRQTSFPVSADAQTTSNTTQIDSNRFARLHVEHDLDHTLEERTAECVEVTEYGRGVTQPEHDAINYEIEGDVLDLMFSMFSYVLELDRICSTIKECWEDVSGDRESLIIAAWLSNFAVQITENIAMSMHEAFPDLHLDDHKYVFEARELTPQLHGLFAIRPPPTMAPRFTPFSNGGAIVRPWIAILMLKDSKDSGDEAEDDMSDPDVREAIEEGKTMKEYLRIIQALVRQDERKYTCLWKCMNPLLVPLEQTLKSRDEIVSTSLVFTLQLLYEVPRSCVMSPPARARLGALRFAMEVKASVEKVLGNESFACNCANCAEDEYHMQLGRLRLDLEVYTREKCFDLYYTNPWVAGAHMMEIFSWATDWGIRLCNLRGHVGAVLHAYNLLTQLDMLNYDTNILGSLCDLLEDEVFMGQRPTIKFDGCFTRFLGGRLRFPKKRAPPQAGGPKGTDRRENWEMKVPQNANRGNDDSRRLIASRMSLFYRIDNYNYKVDAQSWHEILQNKCGPGPICTGSCVIKDEVSKLGGVGLIQKLREAARKEFTGILPVAKVNFFKIYLLSIRVLESIGRQGWQAEAGVRDLPSIESISSTQLVHAGYELVRTLFKVVDEHQDNMLKTKLLPHLMSLRSCRDGLLIATKGQNTLLRPLW
ncbi:hypothetical protein G7Y89_g12715 [Cudoniella acicularis]|uniref:DUF6604 domain-containing protein n=1 Tax=Cudoniella acicularis TaxID=354080 RepID=A0A8H4VWR5_9HELO|nr:hypothetical protein G7Y89_g12715 [Cudoniella acicularis]